MFKSFKGCFLEFVSTSQTRLKEGFKKDGFKSPLGDLGVKIYVLKVLGSFISFA